MTSSSADQAITITPIGFVRSERKDIMDDNWRGLSQIVLNDDIPLEALVGVNEFSHLEIIFHFHKAEAAQWLTLDEAKALAQEGTRAMTAEWEG